MPEGDNFTHAQTHSLEPIDPCLHVGWGLRRNQPCIFFENRPKGFDAGTPRHAR